MGEARCRFHLSGLEKNKFCDSVYKGTEKNLGVSKQFEFGQTPRDSEGQESLACCSSWGRRVGQALRGGSLWPGGGEGRPQLLVYNA